MATNLNQVAAQRGYPSALLGFMPDTIAYWREPGFPTLRALPSPPLDALLPYPPAEPCFQVANDQMGPRFPTGTWVGAELLVFGRFLCPGQVLAWHHVAEERAPYTMARVVEVRAGSLRLAQDKDGHQLTIPWWKTDPDRPLLLVRHYLTPPLPLSPVPPDDSAAQLLEVATDLGPRYPRGARYAVHPVPADAWPQARGVHALALHDGRQLVRRILHQLDGVLVLARDHSGDVQGLPLLEVAQLWKLGAAGYLPEETEAEHRRMGQQPAS